MIRTNPPGIPPHPRNSQVVVHETTGLIYLSGQVGWDEDNELVGDDMATQYMEICRHWDVILESLGLDRTAFLRVVNFVTSIDEYYSGSGLDIPSTAEQFGEYFKEARPAGTLIEVSRFGGPGIRIEADAVLSLNP